MALDKTEFHTTFIGGGRALHVYKTADTASNIAAANYFDGVADRLSVGDPIIALVDTGGTPTTKVHTVSAISAAGAVTLTAAA
jgi:hypothetical protein